MTVDVFTAGGVIIDNVVTADGTVNRNAMGGNAVYSAAGARLWLDRVGIVARVPETYPTTLLASLESHGIETAGILTVAGEVVDEDEWFFYRADGSRADQLHAAAGDPQLPRLGERLSADAARSLEQRLRHAAGSGRDFARFRRRHPVTAAAIPESFLSARGVHLAANEPASQIAMARHCRARDLVVTLDPGSNAAAIGQRLPELLPAINAFLPSEKELALLTPGLAPAPGLAVLRAAGAKTVAVKLGANGSLMLGRDATPTAIPAFKTDARDPTGAGDAYCGGFLAGLVLTGDAVAAGFLATISASFAVESFGPFDLLAIPRPHAVARLHLLLATAARPLRDRLHPLLDSIK